MNKILKLFSRLGKELGKKIRTVAVVCLQFGDTGKGKIVDLLAEWADFIVRVTGGDNAGHTIVVRGKKIIVHLLPSGILRRGKVNILGSGMVINPRRLLYEIAELRQSGVDCHGRLFVANNAKLILPQHIALDRLREMAKRGRIGTTGRGNGPAYEDHCGRIGLVVRDILNPDIFARKLKKNLEEKRRIFRSYDPKAVEKIMAHEDLERGRFYSRSVFFNDQEITEAYLEWGANLAPMIRDTDNWIRREVGQVNILFEGAQGTELGIDNGTYPFVTSSDATKAGMAKGGGLLSEQIDLTLGVVKTPLTRVGDGPLPTQMGGKRLDKWYGGEAVNTAKAEGYSSVEKMALAKFSSFDWNDPDEVKLALALGVEGREFGATTGRPRRIAWPDLPLLRHAVQFNGSFVVLTKLDILSKCPVIKICTAYRYDGPDQWIDGKNCLKKGDMLSVAIPSAEVLEHCRPIYQEFPGWLCNIDQAKSVGELPPKCKRIIRFIEQQAGVKWQILSMGADRNQTIFRE